MALITFANDTGALDKIIDADDVNANFTYLEGTWVDITSACTHTGWAAAGLTHTVHAMKMGKIFFIRFSIDGTSDNATTTLTLPAGYECAANAFMNPVGAYNNSAVIAPALASLTSGGKVITFTRDMAGTAWTASNNKIVSGQIWYVGA